MTVGDQVDTVAADPAVAPDFEIVFQQNYAGIARAVARIIGDHARAEEIAVEAFWRLSKRPEAMDEHCGGWLRRTAIHLALDELRRRSRRMRYETLFAAVRRSPPLPDDVLEQGQEQGRVRLVLAAMRSRDAELLVLHSEGLQYDEIARALGLNHASVGTMLARSRAAFRKEYVKRHGER